MLCTNRLAYRNRKERRHIRKRFLQKRRKLETQSNRTSELEADVAEQLMRLFRSSGRVSNADQLNGETVFEVVDRLTDFSLDPRVLTQVRNSLSGLNEQSPFFYRAVELLIEILQDGV